MQPTEQIKMSVAQNLNVSNENPAFELEQPWMPSEPCIESYSYENYPELNENTNEDISAEVAQGKYDATDFLVTAQMAAGRLDWVLKKTRPSLSGLFSEADVVALLDCNQSDIFSSSNLDRIASDLCDHLGIEIDAYETSDVSTLVETLLDLSPIQRLTLADALEQTWHHGMNQEGKSPRESFEALGIELT